MAQQRNITTNSNSIDIFDNDSSVLVIDNINTLKEVFR